MYQYMHSYHPALYIFALLVCLHYARFSVFKGVTYFFAKMRFKSPYILLGKYNVGLDDVYRNGRRCFLVAGKDGVTICPSTLIFSKKTVIPYENIRKIELLSNSWDDTFDPMSDRFVRYAGRIEMELHQRYDPDYPFAMLLWTDYPCGPFNKYVYEKCKVNFMKELASYLPGVEITITTHC